nr:hypothetical protein Q903MT_gene4621 [Picea sitchensis]
MLSLFPLPMPLLLLAPILLVWVRPGLLAQDLEAPDPKAVVLEAISIKEAMRLEAT